MNTHFKDNNKDKDNVQPGCCDAAGRIVYRIMQVGELKLTDITSSVLPQELRVRNEKESYNNSVFTVYR